MNSLLLKLLPLVLLVLFLLISQEAVACTTCNRTLRAAIFDDSFATLFFLMVLPFALAWAIVARNHKLK